MDKKRQIIETAMKLFADKGYHATSIQEIADGLGIAKGSIYSYFHSKEDLLFSIFEYYFKRLERKLGEIAGIAGVSPREKLMSQTAFILEDVGNNRNFFLMLIKEPASTHDIGDKTHKFIMQMQSNSFIGYVAAVEEIYGVEIKPYSLDCAAIFQGILAEYMKFIILAQLQLNPTDLARFVVDRLDDIVQGILAKKPMVMLPSVLLEEMEKHQRSENSLGLERIFADMNALKIAVAGNPSEFHNADDLISSLEILEEELKFPEPRVVIIKGMLALLMDCPNEHASHLCELLKQWMMKSKQ